MIEVKTEKEINNMKEGGRILTDVIEYLKKEIKPGINTESLNVLAEKMIRARGAEPSFLGYNGYPKSICTSINSEVVHGIPGEKRLEHGDILSIDVGVFYKGFHTDAALTIPVGNISEENQKLINTAKESLKSALKKIKDGATVGDISSAVQKYSEGKGFSVVKDCTGHGIGNNLHEEPEIPNFGEAGKGPVIKEGNTLAIEPMVNMGTDSVETLKDGWTIVTSDGKNSAHFEFTVLVLKEGYENLTPLKV